MTKPGKVTRLKNAHLTAKAYRKRQWLIAVLDGPSQYFNGLPEMTMARHRLRIAGHPSREGHDRPRFERHARALLVESCYSLSKVFEPFFDNRLLTAFETSVNAAGSCVTSPRSPVKSAGPLVRSAASLSTFPSPPSAFPGLAALAPDHPSR